VADEDGVIDEEDDDDKPPELMIIVSSLAYPKLPPFYLTSLCQLFIMEADTCTCTPATHSQ
jgi:hypothetical protein